MAKPYYEPTDSIPLPPADAETLTTACDYCIVACGYKVYRWPIGKSGGPKATENALKVDFPRNILQGGWISPNMHNIISHNGRQHHVVVVPDREAKVVNKGGAHSIRGGAIAQKCFNPKKPTKDRLQTPLLRVNGELVPISWDAATDIFAEVSKHVIDNYGSHAWAQKRYSYQYFENTYALSKFAWVSIKTPATAEHDNPGHFSSTPGWRDIGFENFAACYEDYLIADTVVISGTDPFETKTILFNEWILPGVRERGNKLIYINPRKTTGAAFAEANGGLHLWLNPGTDTLLCMGISRVIIENGWEDSKWIEEFTNNKWESDSGFGQGVRNTPWQWRTTWGKFQCNGYEDFKKWLLSQKESELAHVSEMTGVSIADIRRAAEMMAKPKADGSRVKTTIGIEKGSYWSNNYLNTASIGDLALLCGTGNRPGQMISRMGGHQRGGMTAGGYPRNHSPEKFAGRRRKGLDLDRWVEAGKVRFSWVVGTTWVNAMTATGHLFDTLAKQTINSPHQLKSTDTKAAIEVFKQRTDAGGMLLVEQNIYLTEDLGKKLADLVLPAAMWGECDFTRANGERRIRLYSKFMDPPGDAKPDWEITAMLARKMGFAGYDWKTSNDVFEEAARFGRGGVLNYHPLVKYAKKHGKTGHEQLREYGTTGIQAPIRLEDNELVGTKRLHDLSLALPESGPEGHTVWPKKLKSFNSQTGRANFIKTPWFLFGDFYDEIKPRDGELWVLNGRINEIWQSGFDDIIRRPYITQRWPENFLEVHPDDAAKLGIESGDYVTVTNDRVPVQVSGFIARDVDDLLFTGLKKNGHIVYDKAEVKAVAIVMPVPKVGTTFMYFLNQKESANRVVPRVTDPISDNYRFKLGFGKVAKSGESPYKHTFAQMSFASRAIM